MYLHGFSFVSTSPLKFYSIYVGQGDSSLVILPDKTTLLFDTGTEDMADKFCGEVDAILKQNDIENIDYLFLTHPHNDHYGGGIELFSRFQVLHIFRPIVLSPFENEVANYEVSDDLEYIKFIDKAHEEGDVDFILPMEIEIGNYLLKIWTPLSNSYSDLNDVSPVITISGEGNTLMITGDLTTKGEDEFLSQNFDLNVDLLKVAHHGSKNGTSETFLEKVQPKLAVISAGVDNVYNFPNEELISRLENYTDKIYSTNENGTIAVGFENGQIKTAFGFVFQDKPFFIVIYFVLFFAIFSVRTSYTLKRVKSFSQNMKIS